MKQKISTPVLLIIYKRLETTRQVMDKIRSVQPPRIYISANAPNPANAADNARVAETRAIVNLIDWPCEVITNFRDEHLSAKQSITSGINWFFSNEEAGIILEDDCVVDESFFFLCDELLKKYSDDPRVMHISASNFQEGITRGDGSYYFSRYNHIWGWAGWRRGWEGFDVDLCSKPFAPFHAVLKRTFTRKDVIGFWKQIYLYIGSGKVDTWDTQYMFHMWRKGGIAITPNVNLVRNIGFGIEATNTHSPFSKWANMSVRPVTEIVHPSEKKVDEKADDFTADHLFGISRAAKSFYLKLRASRLIPRRFRSYAIAAMNLRKRL